MAHIKHGENMKTKEMSEKLFEVIDYIQNAQGITWADIEFLENKNCSESLINRMKIVNVDLLRAMKVLYEVLEKINDEAE